MTFCRSCGSVLSNDSMFCPKCGTPVNATTAPPAAPYGTAAPASEMEVDRLLKDSNTQDLWLRRVIAYVIDWIILVIVSSIIGGIAVLAFGIGAFFGGFSGFFFPFYSLAGILFAGIAALLSLVYFTGLDYMNHATFGKNLMGLRVVTIDGSRLDIGKALIRNISKIYALLLLLDLLGGFFMKVTPGQKFSDSIAKTNVVRIGKQNN